MLLVWAAKQTKETTVISSLHRSRQLRRHQFPLAIAFPQHVEVNVAYGEPLSVGLHFVRLRSVHDRSVAKQANLPSGGNNRRIADRSRPKIVQHILLGES